MSSDVRLLTGLRGQRYGEVFLVHFNDPPLVEVYNSFTLNDCPEHLWRALDPVSLASEHGASLAILNGPRYWMMDGIGKVDAVTPIVREFGGIAMRRVATIEPTDGAARSFYTERRVNRGACWYFDVGRPVFELLAPHGATYVLQAYCTGVDPDLNESSLSTLGERLALPAGWHFRERVLEVELVIDTTTDVATVLQDELQNTYTLVR